MTTPKMSRKEFKYGIFNKNEVVHNVNDGSQRTVFSGQVVRISLQVGNKYVVSMLKENNNWETLSFETPQESITTVNDRIWPFLASVASPRERVKLAKNRKKCDSLATLTKDSVVGFADTNDVYLGTVRYIGEVIGIGMCYGIQLHVS